MVLKRLTRRILLAIGNRDMIVPGFQHVHLPKFFSREEHRTRDVSFVNLAVTKGMESSGVLRPLTPESGSTLIRPSGCLSPSGRHPENGGLVSGQAQKSGAGYHKLTIDYG